MEVLKPLFLGNFFGGELSEEEYEKLTFGYIPPYLRAGEADYFGTKWFDYRRLHPMQATFYFIHCYQKIYQEWYRRNIDEEESRFHKGTRNNFLQTSERTIWWRCRRFCDKYGIPYEFFIRSSVKRYFGNVEAKLHFPRPQALYTNTRGEEETVIKEWNDDTSLRYSADPYFTTIRWEGSQAQLDYENYIVSKLKTKRSAFDLILSDAVFNHHAIRLERAIVEFGLREVKRAVKTRQAELSYE